MKRILAIGIILLFIGMSISSSTGFNVNNLPPPIITGPTNGRVGVEYEYTFNSTVPPVHKIRYFIDWGDNNTEWSDICLSGKEVKVNHSWEVKGQYIIRARIENEFGWSDWGTLAVTMPKNHNIFFSQWFDRFPILNQLIIRIMERWGMI